MTDTDRSALDSLSPAEVERLLNLARRPAPGEQPRAEWRPAAPTPRHLLDGVRRCPATGRPLRRDERLPGEAETATRQLELPSQREERDRQEFAAFREWVALSAQQKTQLVADVRWGAEPHPAWLCQLVAEDARAADPGVPPVVLRAVTEADAAFRYQSLCGLTSYNPNSLRLLCTLYTPAEGGAA
jgi:hypothetical protein